ncbi:TetR/AcrR family transcriptional regulator [Raoultibacter massiliensis]|uniref:TetR/AcrR family transcriptional regulator n=1 Tax=Raoultibacter massiliensis TaxID=1852371 RepID=UPI003A907D07
MPKAQRGIQNSLISLLSQKDLHSITVKDICEEADVHRKTFYDYYQDKQDVYESLTLALLLQLCDFFVYEKGRDPSNDKRLSFYDDALAFTRFIDDNIDTVAVLLAPAYQDLWAPLLSKVVEGRQSALFIHATRKHEVHDIPDRLLTDAITSNLIVWTYWWLSQNEYSPEEGAEILERLATRTMTTALRYPIHRTEDNEAKGTS